MRNPPDDLYCMGYIAGYQAGIRDAISGKTAELTEGDIANLPIHAMALSTRARNCLERAGCACVGDAAALSGHTIATRRNMGTKTASEIAHWLASHGICYSAWSDFL